MAQIQRCADAGADIMRVSVPSMEAAEAFGAIKSVFRYHWLQIFIFDHRIALAVAIMVQTVYGSTQEILVQTKSP